MKKSGTDFVKAIKDVVLIFQFLPDLEDTGVRNHLKYNNLI